MEKNEHLSISMLVFLERYFRVWKLLPVKPILEISMAMSTTKEKQKNAGNEQKQEVRGRKIFSKGVY
jgi:hypothetical protein